jgi:hypothetical protein
VAPLRNAKNTSGEYGSVEEMFGAIEQATSAAQAMVAESDCPITREEFEKFVRVDLKCLDSSDYFKRHFS